MELTDAMLAHVFRLLDELEPGDKLLIKKMAPNNPALWIECAKRYIDVYKNCDFNKSYTKIKKLDDTLNDVWHPQVFTQG